ncbi:unnamed protein product [Linum trigynum]|uniref:Uncharacterized protein n=1 Tax=Linum trigynum TaxID=586398 RepID=A0AAV2E0J8_9ROSI
MEIDGENHTAAGGDCDSDGFEQILTWGRRYRIWQILKELEDFYFSTHSAKPSPSSSSIIDDLLMQSPVGSSRDRRRSALSSPRDRRQGSPLHY